ncbi:ImmA/IrrE family metallo-endopeptidase [Paenarthrobacter sp. CM16]|uniref:ImmA/IrrE family metallo-endopeptidase n=1 Tax=Paenarthrobacter sp. CM16 TaxID=2738447 RepID=UPI0015556E65|nr:ImmA/IrrE family metallo-endopeptidase [Paenarthrobacter sp. CM16]NQD86633.1 ImmA/IrrE family metallo-endopeptidase [Paenarthrobacter sp. CM16]
MDQLDLNPPIEIEKLVELHASVHAFPSDIPNLDAVLLGLDASDNHVFVNTQRSPKRRRFTMAHELGHILLPWHQAHELICEADNEDHPDDPDLSHKLPGSDPVSQEIRLQELEADAFAARTLVPKRFIDSFGASHVPEMLEKLEAAEVSIPAGMRALAEGLPPGYVFVMLDDDDLVERVWRSGPEKSGVPSVLGIYRGTKIDTGQALRTLADHGWAWHYNRRIWWGRADIDLQVPEGSPEWRPILEKLCNSVTKNRAEANRMWASASAIGGALNNEVGEVKVERMAGLLALRLRRNEDLDPLVTSENFDEYVFSRARDLVLSAHKKRYRA